MKKLYLFLTLVLAIIGIGVTRALIVDPSESQILPLEDIEVGKTVVIGCPISSYNSDPVSFANEDKLYDDGTSTDLKQGRKPVAECTPSYVWELEAGSAEGWYYLKNCSTGRYWSYKLDPKDTVEDYAEEGAGVSITLVDEKEQAKEFTFTYLDEGAKLLNPDIDLSSCSYLHVMEAAAERGCVMVITKVTVDGQDFYYCMNDAIPGGTSNYTDWAGYMDVIEVGMTDDPLVEFQTLLKDIEIKVYRTGDDPGCVEQTERAEYFNKRIAELQDEIDNDHDDAYWLEAIQELRALIEEARGFTYRPMRAGYFRFVSAYAEYMSQQGHEKAMFGRGDELRWGKLDEGEDIVQQRPVLDENGEPVVDEDGNPVTEEVVTGKSGLNFIWQVIEKDGKFYVKNFDTQKYIVAQTAQSANYKMSYDEEFVEFTQLGALGDFNLKVGGKGYALHTGGHGGGSGSGSTIVGWDGGSGGASAWYVRGITEEQMKEIWGDDVIDKADVIGRFNSLLAAAKEDMQNAKNSAERPLVTSASQISSPKTQAGEGSIANLLDGDYSTYWHSEWSGGDVSADNSLHYLQFAFSEAAQNVVMKYCRRPSSNDHPTMFKIFASTTADGEFAEIVEFPVATNDAGEATAGANNTLYSYDIDLGAEYSYVRVLATMTDYWRGYWHASEMNFYVSGGVDLWAKAQPAADALEAAIAAAEAVEVPTQADIDALQAAYDAFLAVYTDPNPLKKMISTAKAELKMIGGGNSPGQKPEAAWNALNNAADAANAWLEANLAACTKAQLKAEEDKMDAALKTWEAVPANEINTNTWYYIQMPNNRSCHTATEWYEAGASFVNARVAARYAYVDDLNDFGGDATSVTGIVTEPMYSGEVDGYTYEDDMALWRFIEAGDGKYAIQNKATGNFMPVITGSNQSPLKNQLVPGKYDIRSLGNGQYDFGSVYGYNDKGEEKVTYINIYGQGYLGAYGYDGNNDSGCAWQIVTKEAIATDYVQPIIASTDGVTLRGLVLPYAINLDGIEGDAQFFTDVANINVDEKSIDLKQEFEAIPAGKPFVLFNSSDAEDVNVSTIKMGESKLSWNVDNSGLIIGTLTLANDTIYAGELVPTVSANDNNVIGELWGAFATLAKDQVAVPGQAWIDIHNNPAILESTEEGDETFVLDLSNGDIKDAIEVVKAENGQYNVIYNLNGQRVSAPVKGVMIINGKKVIIK